MSKVYVLQKNTKYFDGHRVTVNNRTCVVCSAHFKRDMKLNQHIPDNNACGSCQFWYDLWRMRDDPRCIRIDGLHYMLATDPGLSATILMRDGRIVRTNYLRHQGQIPKVWIGLGLEDNAEFHDA